MNRYNSIKCPQTLYCKTEEIAGLANEVIDAIYRELSMEQASNLVNNINVVVANDDDEEYSDNEYYAATGNEVQTFFENWVDFADFDAAFEELCIHATYDCGCDRNCEKCRFWSSCCKDQKDA